MTDWAIDEALEQKIRPMIDSAMQQFLGVTVEEIRSDITDKLKTAPFFEFNLHTDKPYKKAKELLRAEFLKRLLRKHFGNVSIASKIAGLDRRSMHRLIEKYRIEVERFRQEMTKRSYLKEMAVTNLLTKTIEVYKPVLNEQKVESLYANLPDLSKSIAEALPEKEMTLEEAEKEWEKRYLLYHLEKSRQNVSATARSIGLRYETLHRKLKEAMLSTNI